MSRRVPRHCRFNQQLGSTGTSGCSAFQPVRAGSPARVVNRVVRRACVPRNDSGDILQQKRWTQLECPRNEHVLRDPRVGFSTFHPSDLRYSNARRVCENEGSRSDGDGLELLLLDEAPEGGATDSEPVGYLVEREQEWCSAEVADLLVTMPMTSRCRRAFRRWSGARRGRGWC